MVGAVPLRGDGAAHETWEGEGESLVTRSPSSLSSDRGRGLQPPSREGPCQPLRSLHDGGGGSEPSKRVSRLWAQRAPQFSHVSIGLPLPPVPSSPGVCVDGTAGGTPTFDAGRGDGPAHAALHHVVGALGGGRLVGGARAAPAVLLGHRQAACQQAELAVSEGPAAGRSQARAWDPGACRPLRTESLPRGPAQGPGQGPTHQPLSPSSNDTDGSGGHPPWIPNPDLPGCSVMACDVNTHTHSYMHTHTHRSPSVNTHRHPCADAGLCACRFAGSAAPPGVLEALAGAEAAKWDQPTHQGCYQFCFQN